MATPALAPAIRIDPGNSRDLDDVMTVMESAFGTAYGEAWTRSQCAGILPMTGVALTIAREEPEGRAIGFSLVRCVADDCELLLLAVLPEHHRRGIGGRLLDAFVEGARTKGIAKLHLEVREGNPAVEMYRSAGFEPVGRRRNYYRGENGDRFDALTLARRMK